MIKEKNSSNNIILFRIIIIVIGILKKEIVITMIIESSIMIRDLRITVLPKIIKIQLKIKSLKNNKMEDNIHI